MQRETRHRKHPSRPWAPTKLTRRAFAGRLVGGLTLLATPLGWVRPAHAEAAAAAPARPSDALLERSAFVYISPLHSNGRESTCHAEVWYAWLDGSVVVTVARDRWKATALTRGLDQARIWVGDHGRWKTWMGGRNEAFREAPHFDARVEKVSDPKLLDRLLAVYEVKYPDEVANWRDRMRQGNADGSRVMLRYTPV